MEPRAELQMLNSSLCVCVCVCVRMRSSHTPNRRDSVYYIYIVL